MSRLPPYMVEAIRLVLKGGRVVADPRGFRHPSSLVPWPCLRRAGLVPSAGIALDPAPPRFVSRESLVNHRMSLLHTAVELGGTEEVRLKIVAKRIEDKIVKGRASIEAHCLADPNFRTRYEIVRSIPGIGLVNAANVCCLMPELGLISNRQIASFFDVAPGNRDSGGSPRQRHIRGG